LIIFLGYPIAEKKLIQIKRCGFKEKYIEDNDPINSTAPIIMFAVAGLLFGCFLILCFLSFFEVLISFPKIMLPEVEESSHYSI